MPSAAAGGEPFRKSVRWGFGVAPPFGRRSTTRGIMIERSSLGTKRRRQLSLLPSFLVSLGVLVSPSAGKPCPLFSKRGDTDKHELCVCKDNPLCHRPDEEGNPLKGCPTGAEGLDPPGEPTCSYAAFHKNCNDCTCETNPYLRYGIIYIFFRAALAPQILQGARPDQAIWRRSPLLPGTRQGHRWPSRRRAPLRLDLILADR